MRIAIVSQRDPVPVYTGLLERIYQLSRFLGVRHIVKVYYPYETYRKQNESGWIPQTRPFERDPVKSKIINLLDKYVPPYSPLRGVYNLHPWMYSALRRRLLRFEPEAVIVETPFLVPVTKCATRNIDCQTILTEHNINYRVAERLDIPLSGAFRRFEMKIAESVDTVVAVSTTDEEILQENLREAKIRVAENGVDIQRYNPDRKQPEFVERRREQGDIGSPLFIYHGNLGNAQNSEAVEELLSDIFPAIRSVCSPATLLLVGADPPDSDLPGVVATGVVDELPRWVPSADAAVVPLRSGSGTKLKILEYLASGVPVVTTPIGAEGLPLEDQTHALIETGTEDIVNAALRLVSDQKLYKQLESNGRTLAEERFNWDKTLQTYERILKQNKGK